MLTVYFLQAAEFFFFAALMALATILYAIMGYFYKSYVPARGEKNGTPDLQQLTASDELAAADNKDIVEHNTWVPFLAYVN